MDRPTLVTALLCLATIVAYSDEICLWVRAFWGGEKSRFDATRVWQEEFFRRAFEDLQGRDPLRLGRTTALLRVLPGPEPTRFLMGLLEPPCPEVAARAADILREREDPAATHALYSYLARRPAA